MPSHIPLTTLAEFLNGRSLNYEVGDTCQVDNIHYVKISVDLKHSDHDSPYTHLFKDNLSELNQLCKLVDAEMTRWHKDNHNSKLQLRKD